MGNRESHRPPARRIRPIVSVCLAALTVAPLALGQELGEFSPGLPESAESYRTQRQRLVAADVAQRFDAQVRLTAAEQRLNERLARLRRSLLDEYQREERFPPSEPFHRVREEIRGTELYRLLRAMPKGGALHLHTSSTAPADWVVAQGIREPHCYICWPIDCGSAIQGQLGFFSEGKAPPGYRAAADLLREDPEFPKKLLALLTIGADDENRSSLEIWSEFDRIFQRIGGLVSYQPVFLKYYRAAFQTLVEDHVFYVELRAGFGNLYDLSGRAWTYRDRASLLWDLRNEMRKTHPHFDLKLIYSGYRRGTKRQVWTDLQQAVELRRQWAEKNFILGFDLVGEEDAGWTTKHFLLDWVKLRSLLDERKASLPLYFHDGESDWPSDKNLYDAFLLGTRRIGHGFNLFRFPLLERQVTTRGIAVEVCPISNQQLRYVADLRVHPASGYLPRGLPVVLSNDDPGIFRNDGLSFDFWEAMMAWDLDLRALKQLARNSLKFSGMTEAENRAATADWEKRWDAWVKAWGTRQD